VTPTYDFVQLIVDDLAGMGYTYDPVSTSVNFQAEAPGLLAGGPGYVAFTDRDVVLARSEAKISVSNPQHGSYGVQVVLESPTLGTVTVPRGWASVDVDVRGTAFRFVDTHLEAYSSVVRDYQAIQLTTQLAAYGGQLVVVGDFNSSAPPAGGDSSNAYDWMVVHSYADSWLARPRATSGLTCCQDGSLTNAVSQLDERIDFVFLRGGPNALGMQLVGDQPADRTASGLWPSDHAGVVADVRVA
jgi:endonuclease/exonuclease/phosphatase family metal-dependent hydrolase